MVQHNRPIATTIAGRTAINITLNISAIATARTLFGTMLAPLRHLLAPEGHRRHGLALIVEDYLTLGVDFEELDDVHILEVDLNTTLLYDIAVIATSREAILRGGGREA